MAWLALTYSAVLLTAVAGLCICCKLEEHRRTRRQTKRQQTSLPGVGIDELPLA